jgi:subtilisin family serine protease
MIHFACAGNTGGVGITYPGSIALVNAVTSIMKTGALAGFATTGAGLDFVGPGDDILTTDRLGAAGYVAGDFVTIDGCSFATPYAAGIAALLLSAHPDLTPIEVEAAMQLGAVDMGAVGYDTTFGHGRLNALAALQVITKPGDLTFDDKINGADLGLLLAAWNTTNAAADLDHNGTVGGEDLGILLAAWNP